MTTTSDGIATRDDIEMALWQWSEWRADQRRVSELLKLIDQYAGSERTDVKQAEYDALARARVEADQIVQSARDEAARITQSAHDEATQKIPECDSEGFSLMARSVVPADIYQDSDAVLWLRLGVAASNVMLTAQTTRKCSRCGRVKRITAFCLNRNSRDGRRAMCRGCENAGRKRKRESKKVSEELS